MANLLEKAITATASARLLFDAGDYDGCTNRAYYAMFDAARSYLKARHDISLSKIKTHAGVLSAFSRLGIQQDGLDPELGRILNRAMIRRSTADYDERAVERDAAARTLAEMASFLDIVSKAIKG